MRLQSLEVYGVGALIEAVSGKDIALLCGAYSAGEVGAHLAQSKIGWRGIYLRKSRGRRFKNTLGLDWIAVEQLLCMSQPALARAEALDLLKRHARLIPVSPPRIAGRFLRGVTRLQCRHSRRLYRRLWCRFGSGLPGEIHRLWLGRWSRIHCGLLRGQRREVTDRNYPNEHDQRHHDKHGSHGRVE